jgi:hypothetical protein
MSITANSRATEASYLKNLKVILILVLLFLPFFALPSAHSESGEFNSLIINYASNITVSSNTQSGLVYRVDSQSYINQFSYVSVLASVQVNNTASSSSQPAQLSIAFPGYYSKYLLNFNSTGITLSESFSNNTLLFKGMIPSLQPKTGMLVTVGLSLWGMVTESSPPPGVPPTYYFATSSIPDVKVSGGTVTNATSTIGLPSSVTVTNIPNINNSIYSQLASNLYFYKYRNASAIFPSTVNISFSPNSASTSSFAIYRVVKVVRIVTLADNGAINVQDYVTIQNNDSAALTSILLTNPSNSQYQISGGVVRPRYISLSSGTISVSSCYQPPTSAPSCQPVPVEPHDHATFIIYYSLPSSSISKAQSGIEVNLSKNTLTYPSLYGSYQVVVSLPKGSSYQFLTQNNFSNVRSIPVVLVLLKVPFGYQLDPVLGVAVAVLIIFIAVFSIYSIRNRSGPDAEVDSIIKQKKEVVSWLLEDIRQRGEGFSPYAYFTEERKQYEEERNRLNVKINSLREIARKDKSYRQAVDKLLSEDSKIEQVYRESRQLLEEKLSGKVDEAQFKERIKALQLKIQE